MNDKRLKTILLVEDEALIALSEKMMLEKYQYRVVLAYTGEQAIAMAAKMPEIDLILMDIDLGRGMDGTQAAACILEERLLPVVFLSSHVEKEIVEKTETITSYGYVVKNSGITILDASIKMAFKLFAANRALSEQQTLLLSIAENYPNSYISIIESDYTVGFTSGQEFAKQKLDPKQFVGLSLEQVFGEYAPVVRTQYQVTFAGKECSFELFSNNQYQLYKTAPIRSPDGSIKRIVSVVENITERKQAEAALNESQALLKQILDTAPQSIFWKDKQGIYLGCNQTFARACGLEDAEQIVGKTDFDLPWPKTEAEAYRADDAQVMISQTPKRHIIEPLQQANGDRLWIDTSKMPLFNAQQEVHGVLGIYEDITERKATEEHLRENEERYRQLVNISPDLIAIHQGGKIVFINPGGARLLKAADPEQLIGRPLTEFLPPGRLEIAQQRIVHLLSAGGQTPFYEQTLRCLDGTDVEVEVIGILFSYQGQPAVQMIARDITERKRAQEQSKQLAEQPGKSVLP